LLAKYTLILNRLIMNYSNCDSDDKLLAAIRCNDYDGVVKAIEAGADVNKYHDSWGRTLTNIYVAIEKNKYDGHDNVKIIKYLISKGANLDQANGPLCWTVLHYASFYNMIDFVKLLLENGADSGIKDGRGFDAVGIAGSIQNDECAEYIRSYNDIPVKGVNS